MMCSDPVEACKSAAGVAFFFFFCSLHSSPQPPRSLSELSWITRVAFECNPEVREAERWLLYKGRKPLWLSMKSVISRKVAPAEAGLRNYSIFVVVFIFLNCMNNASCVGGTVWTRRITETSPGDTETQQTTTMDKTSIKRVALMKRMTRETFFSLSLFKGQGHNSQRNAPKFLQSPDACCYAAMNNKVIRGCLSIGK